KHHTRGVRKIFLADGDALVAKASYLHQVLDAIREAFPNLQRVSCYASPQSLQIRTVEEMRELKQAGLTQYYLGVESGCDETLLHMEKGVDGAEMIRVANKAHEAGIKLSTMILLGVGGRKGSDKHARESARVIQAIAPRFLSTLVVTPVEGTPLWDQKLDGEVDELTPIELAQELRTFLANLDLKSTIFRSNHASNYLALKGTLGKDKDALVNVLDEVLANPRKAAFVPEWLRAL
ncbi:MAG: radical SAM protein, partial [Planctomycetota bacterium]|nr:radical SAM protein [Planctomycetota bacterium]